MIIFIGNTDPVKNNIHLITSLVIRCALVFQLAVCITYEYDYRLLPSEPQVLEQLGSI